MTTPSFRSGLLVAACLAACSTSSSDGDGPRGGVGESCTRRADCEDGLRCFGGVCSADGDGSSSGGGAGGAGTGGAGTGTAGSSGSVSAAGGAAGAPAKEACGALPSDRCITPCDLCCQNAGAYGGECVSEASGPLHCVCFAGSGSAGDLPTSTPCGGSTCPQGEYCRISGCSGPAPLPDAGPCQVNRSCTPVPEVCFGSPRLCSCILKSQACDGVAVGGETCEEPCP